MESIEDLTKLLAELKSERALVEDAVVIFQRLALKGGMPRGRPPKWMKEFRRRGGRPKGSKNKPKQPASGPSFR